MEEKSLMLEIKSLINEINRFVEYGPRKYGISGIQFFIIEFLLENQGIDTYQKDIEKIFNIRRSSASALLQSLTKNGFIERVVNTSDARLKIIILTNKSLNLIKEFKAGKIEFDKKLEQNITLAERETFISVLNKMKNNFKENCLK